MSVTIPISHKGELKSIIIDAEDQDKIKDITWCIDIHGYVKATHKYKCIKLHRYIMNVTDPKIKLKHMNDNKLDNRKCNLRVCSNAENHYNTKKPINNTSGYKGVSFVKSTGKWQALIRVNGQQKHIGLYLSVEDAARAYDDAARIHHGEFARLNFPRDGEQAA